MDIATLATRRVGPWQVFSRVVVLVCLGTAAAGSAAQTTERFSVSMQGQNAGTMVTTSDAQGRTSVDFSYRNNGRGPDMKEEFSVDAQGAPLSYRVDGKSTFGGDIRESYSWAAGQGTWTSLVDSGKRAVEAGALYYPVEGSPAFLAQLMRSLLARPDRAAPAVAGGRFSIERLDQVSLQANGTTVPLALYALIGADLTPAYLWLRDDASQAFFALVFPGWELVAQGFEAEGAGLLKRQLAAENRYLQSLQQRLAKPLAGLTVIRSVRWFDAERAVMRPPADVYLFDGRIAAIEPAGSPRAAEAEHSIDGQGRTLLPGLFDMHGHLWRGDLLLDLAAGVTSVRDVGNDNAALLELRTQIEQGLLAGPRVTANGFIEGKSPFSARLGIVVDSLDEAKAAVDWYARHGYHQLKIYNSFKPAWLKPLAAYAHARGLRVGGHVPAFMRAEEAVRAGYDELHHINQVMLNFFVKPKDDTRTLLRFVLVGDKAHAMDLDGTRVRDFLKLLRGARHRRRPDGKHLRGDVHPAQWPAQSVVRRDLRPHAGGRAAQPAEQFRGRQRRERQALRQLLHAHARDDWPHAQGRRAAAGRHRQLGRLLVAPRARALREGGHSGARGAADRHPQWRPLHPDGGASRRHCTRQAGRSGARRR